MQQEKRRLIWAVLNTHFEGITWWEKTCPTGHFAPNQQSDRGFYLVQFTVDARIQSCLRLLLCGAEIQNPPLS